ncbi:MAG: type I restriction endonuclease subunit R [Gemmatimonadetes bacterium]|nr:type I restriction endonuclease subunit R [Gemmatimonadota bacterium]MYD27993.1 type I restriction endonuclease subunit R [Dehalococcoidia bacterium]MYI65281.1 type I restriction endonuclease subunit R [Gemmatimonadota bacterium]
MSDLTQRQRDQIQALEALPDDQIDLSDAPETLNWSNAVRGKFHRLGEEHVGRPARTTTDTSEEGLERLICTALTGAPCDQPDGRTLQERPASYNAGWICGEPRDYDREYCVDLVQLAAFLQATQPDAAESFDLDTDGPSRRKFLARLQGEITKRGTIDVLRKGVSHGPHRIDLMYGAPSPGNEAARVRYGQNRFSVTRQLRYSRDEAQLALDLCLFVNGVPVATFELKNSLTKQTVADAVEQYKRDRNPREKLFELGRCLVHFAVDDHEVQFCTQLQGKASWFLPFNRGWDGGAGNPTNPNGLKTDYLWKQILTRDGLTDIIENYAQIVETKDEKTGRKRREQLWPRYHQLDVVRELLADVSEQGVGRRYLIQHSAGSGKSNSIAWLAHQLIGLERDGAAIVDSVIVVTDRRILDRQIRDTIKQFAQVGSTVGHAQDAAHLRTLLEEGKRIVITTVQKFPRILDAIGDEHRGRNFAIVIDEAHSSQGGRTSASVSMALGEAGAVDEDETTEDAISRLMESRKLLSNASYFAFTATPKNKTLEIFGDPLTEGAKTRHAPFHSYTMKQAIQEGFIIDVLRNYTPVDSYYRLVKTVEGDPEFDTKRAGKKLRRYVEDNDHAIRLKAEIMVDHFHEQVAGLQKIGGEARAMVVTSSVQQAISYYDAIRNYLTERRSPYRAIVAFSGEHEYGGAKVTESSLNGFSSNLIAERIREEPFRFLVCADKFQTGYDEPLLHTMYVDKQLSGVKAVQTLSRLNRAHPGKRDALVVDFANDADTIQTAFADYYRTTILAEETDPDRLHDLKAALDGYQVYAPEQVDDLVERYLAGAERDRLDPILDACVAVYREQLDEDGQVDFKGKAKAFLRTYDFLAAILPYTYRDWERLSIFLTFLVPKLPAPIEDDLSEGILDAIDMDSYRVEKQAVRDIQLPDEDAEIGPVPTDGGGQKPEAELDRLSNILREFNDRFGNIEWRDHDKIEQVIAEELPRKVAEDRAYQNAMANSDRQNARIEHDKALERAMTDVLADHTELFKQFSDNESFRRWLSEMVFAVTYSRSPSSASPAIA